MNANTRARNAVIAAGAGALARDMYKVAKGSTTTWLQRRKSRRMRPEIKRYGRNTYGIQLKGESKRIVTDITYSSSSRSDNQLYGYNLCNIAQGDNINDRFRQMIYVSGVHVQFHAQNATTANQLWRWAIIQPRSNRDFSTPNLENEFFRGANTLRAVDWGAVTLAHHKATYPINPDIWKVFGEGFFELNGTTSQGGSGRLNKLVNRYVPCGTNVIYEGSSNTSDNTAVVFVHWCCGTGTNSSTPGTIGNIITSGSFLTYFKDII